MLKADKHLHPNEKLIRLKRNKPFFLWAALKFCDSKVNQSILHLLIKNLIQSRYKMLYRKKKRAGNYNCLSLKRFWAVSSGKYHSSLIGCLMFHSTLSKGLCSVGEEKHFWVGNWKPFLHRMLLSFAVENNFSLLSLSCSLSFTRKQKTKYSTFMKQYVVTASCMPRN